MPKVSIITPLFNGANFIQQAIDSVAAQTFGDFEHIIIDNGSSDEGYEIAHSAAEQDARIVLLQNLRAPGAGPTRNMGIERASGDIIAFLDADDSWFPTKLDRQVSFMTTNGIGFSWTSYLSHDDEGVQLREIRADRHATYDDWLFKRTAIGCLTAAYDSRLLGKHYMNTLPMRQDFCLWLDLMKAAESRGVAVGGLDEILARYRVHEGGMTSNKTKAARMQWRAYREHVGLSRLSTLNCFASYAWRGIAQRASRQ